MLKIENLTIAKLIRIYLTDLNFGLLLACLSLELQFLLVLVSIEFFAINLQRKRKSQNKMLSKQDTGLWKVRGQKAKNHHKMLRQNVQVWLGHYVKNVCNWYTCHHWVLKTTDWRWWFRATLDAKQVKFQKQDWLPYWRSF